MAADPERYQPTPPKGAQCVRCGYALVGLERDGVCPECGTDVSASWPAWALEDCHAAYLDHVRKEFDAIMMAVMGASVSFACLAVASFFYVLGADARAWFQVVPFAGMIGVGSLVFLPLMLASVWQQLSRHPNSSLAPGCGPRRSLRLGLLAGIAVMVAVVVMGGMGPFSMQSGLMACVLGVSAALLWPALGTLRYSAAMLHRAGRTSARSWAMGGLTPALGLLVLATLGSVGWGMADAWAAFMALAAMLLPVAGLWRRCTAVLGAVRALQAEAERREA